MNFSVSYGGQFDQGSNAGALKLYTCCSELLPYQLGVLFISRLLLESQITMCVCVNVSHKRSVLINVPVLSSVTPAGKSASISPSLSLTHSIAFKY